MFQSKSSPELHRFRQRVLSAFGAVVVFATFALALFGPWLEVTAVEVAGTRALNPESVQAVTKKYLEGKSWLVLPRRNLWLLSKKNLAQHLKQKISSKLSIEAVTITKYYPHRIVVNITERTPVFTWSNGQGFATIDHQGVLIELIDQADPALDVVRDELATSIMPDQHVLIPEVADKLLELKGALRRNNLTIKEFIIPTPTCPLAIPRPEQLATINGNENANDSNTNIHNSDKENVNAVETETPPCDILDLRKKSQEIHVQLKDGAIVLFDRHSNLDSSVVTLKRLLAQPENVKATYIDVRFEERAFIR